MVVYVPSIIVVNIVLVFRVGNNVSGVLESPIRQALAAVSLSIRLKSLWYLEVL